ncbi:transport and golgi organization 2 domain-containing protein [Sarocladium implicatum]|nr:transport and golgi organization 2 domain-containing protein [Sarocladium implicatum]
MCIVLLTTAHPDYALIAIDNRDEFVLRPTSRPHWWNQPGPSSALPDTSPDEVTATRASDLKAASILSSRDLYRPEKGTWLGITRTGLFAVLTNFREPAADTAVAGARSRGGMVKAWLGGLPDEEGGSVMGGVRRLVEVGEGVRNVGGFSMVCTRLRRRTCDGGEGVAIVSNRSEKTGDVPLIAQQRDGVWGLSNAVYSEEEAEEWPKVKIGKRLLRRAITEAVEKQEKKEDLIERLFGVLDEDTLPGKGEEIPMLERMTTLRQSVFIPPLGDEANHREVVEGMKLQLQKELNAAGDPNGFDKGLYGAQRQTVVLVDWEGKVTFVERALWDEWGHKVKRGEGDILEEFGIEGWDD